MYTTIALFSTALLIFLSTLVFPLRPVTDVSLASSTPSTPQVAKSKTVVLMVDRSGSMDSEYLESARTAAKSIVHKLNDNDRVALISYSSDAQIELNLTSLASARLDIQHMLNDLVAGGGSNLSSAIQTGRNLLKDQESAHFIILTDGRVNLGLTEPEALTQLAFKGRNQGIYLSTIGIGNDVNHTLMRQLAQAGGGNYRKTGPTQWEPL